MSDKNNKLRNTDRILVLKPIEGKNTLSSTGLVDPRLFNGDNKLHAVMNLQNTTWSFKYDAGGLPEPLKQKFTSFSKCLEHAKQYFTRRNIDITEVID